MNLALKIAALAALVLLTACLFRFFLLEGELRNTLKQTSHLAAQSSTDEERIATQVSGLIATAKDASDKAVAAEGAQLDSIAKTNTEIFKTARAARTTLDRLNRSVNDVVVPQFAKNLQQTADAFSSAAADLHETTASMQPAIENLTIASKAAADNLSDPAIPAMLLSLEQSGKNLEKGSDQAVAILTDGRQVADKARETYLKPVNLWWALIKNLLPLGPTVATAAK